VTLTVAKINEIFLYTLIDNKGKKKFALNKKFYMKETVIRHSFIIQQYLFAFDNKGAYFYENLCLNDESKSSEIEIKDLYTINISY
jgi:hypothetical protein